MAEGLWRVPLPLPDAGLAAVNCYVGRSDEGFTLIDPGWAWDDTREALASALSRLGGTTSDIARIVVTHHHPDHYSYATELREQCGAPVLIGAMEIPSIAALGDLSRPLSPGVESLLRSSGSVELAEAFESIARPPGDLWQRFAPPDGVLSPGDRVAIGAVEMKAVWTPGHTLGHLAFVSRDAGVAVTGDHVLPGITPSVGFEVEPPSLALAMFLQSLGAVAGWGTLRGLPAHGGLIPDVTVRAAEIAAHHDERLREIEDVLDRSQTAVEAAARIGWTTRHRAFADLDLRHRLLAVVETRLHLNHLVWQRRATAEDTDGVVAYLRAE